MERLARGWFATSQQLPIVPLQTEFGTRGIGTMGHRVAVRHQGANYSCAVEVCRPGALTSYAVGQGVSGPSITDLAEIGGPGVKKFRARMDTYDPDDAAP
jgi:hypothetical protein